MTVVEEKPKTLFGPLVRGVGWYVLPSGDKRWRVVYRKGRKQRSKGGFLTEGAADHWRSHNAVKVDTGKWVDSTNAREDFGPYVTDWFRDASDGVGRDEPLKPKTQQLYDSLLKNHILPYFKATQFRDFDRQAIKDWLAVLRKKPAKTKTGRLSRSTVAKAYRLLHQILDEAVEDGKLIANPCNIKKAEGLRWGEAIALERHHIDLEAGTIKVRQQVVELNGQPPTCVRYLKTEAGWRTVNMTGATKAALCIHLAQHVDDSPDAPLFPARTRNGKTSYLRESNWRRSVWLPAVGALGYVGLHFHDLRHIALTLAGRAGATLAELMALAGHANEKAAMRYQHSDDASQRVLAAKRTAQFSIPSGQATGTDDATASNVVPFRPRR